MYMANRDDVTNLPTVASLCSLIFHQQYSDGQFAEDLMRRIDNWIAEIQTYNATKVRESPVVEPLPVPPGYSYFPIGDRISYNRLAEAREAAAGQVPPTPAFPEAGAGAVPAAPLLPEPTGAPEAAAPAAQPVLLLGGVVIPKVTVPEIGDEDGPERRLSVLVQRAQTGDLNLDMVEELQKTLIGDGFFESTEASEEAGDPRKLLDLESVPDFATDFFEFLRRKAIDPEDTPFVTLEHVAEFLEEGTAHAHGVGCHF